MNFRYINNSKNNRLASLIILFFWPFMAILVGVKNYKSSFAKTLLIGGICFIGMTAISEGDLEVYESLYELNSRLSVSEMFMNFVSFKEGKLYMNFLTFFINLFTDNHHIYFAFLYLIFGYYLINFIYLFVDEDIISTKTLFGVLFFLSFALFFSIRNSLNTAFYTGVIYYMYYFSKAILNNNNKILFYLVAIPLFHFSLALLFLPTFLYLYFNNKPSICLGLVIITLAVSQSNVTGIFKYYAESNKGTLIENKYKSYASEGGIERLEERYQKGELNYNWKLKTLNSARDVLVRYAMKLGTILIFIYRKRIKLSKVQMNMLCFVLLLWATSNLTINFGNGSRFLILFSSMAFALFVLLFNDAHKARIYRNFTMILLPISLVFGIMSLYASNKFISINFFISNFFLETFNLL